jgi:hypothetical protein
VTGLAFVPQEPFVSQEYIDGGEQMRKVQRAAIEAAREYAAQHADILRELRRLAGAAGGRASTDAKAEAARKNGMLGGRPKKVRQ